MKSREGTVVDADDLMQEMIDTAQKIAEDLGKLVILLKKNKIIQYDWPWCFEILYIESRPKKRILFQKNLLILQEYRAVYSIYLC
jgi:arginyl-tRNA synthetase